jgi:hypothetical protein
MEKMHLSWLPWAMQEQLGLFLFAVMFLEAKTSHVTVADNCIFANKTFPIETKLHKTFFI